MGYFSFTCAKTGLPVVSSDSGCDPKFYKVRLLERDGTVIVGSYDGYGNIGRYSEAATEVAPGGSKLVLDHFYNGESFEQLGESGHDPQQGCFDPELHPAMFAAQERSDAFDGRQYRQRLKELSRLRSSFNRHVEEALGVTSEARYGLASALDWAGVKPDDEVEALVRAAWDKALQTFPGGALPPDHPLHGMSAKQASEALDANEKDVSAAMTREVVAAWVDGRQTRTPEFAAFGSQVVTWLAPAHEPHTASAAPRRPRV